MKEKKQNKFNFWEVINKPLSIVIILGILFLMFGQKEKVKCDYYIEPNIDVLKKENKSNDMIVMLLEYYSEPFVANFTFDSYEEALAYKKMAIDSQNHLDWYTPRFVCDEDKITLPTDIKDFVNK